MLLFAYFVCVCVWVSFRFVGWWSLIGVWDFALWERDWWGSAIEGSVEYVLFRLCWIIIFLHQNQGQFLTLTISASMVIFISILYFMYLFHLALPCAAGQGENNRPMQSNLWIITLIYFTLPCHIGFMMRVIYESDDW